MFLRRYPRRKNGKTHSYGALVESYRTGRGSRQRVVAYLGKSKRGEHSGWAQLGRKLSGREEIPRATVAAILCMARLCEPSSELHIEESWYPRTALDDLLDVPAETVYTDRLYGAMDVPVLAGGRGVRGPSRAALAAAREAAVASHLETQHAVERRCGNATSS